MRDEVDGNVSEASSFLAFVNENTNMSDAASIVESQNVAAQCESDMVNDKSYFDELNKTKPISIAVAKDGAKLELIDSEEETPSRLDENVDESKNSFESQNEAAVAVQNKPKQLSN